MRKTHKKCLKEIKSKIVKQNPTKSKQIELSYNLCIHRNYKVIKVLQYIIDNYNQIGYDEYNLISNLYTNCNFSIANGQYNKCKDWKDSVSFFDTFQLVKTNRILEEKNKKSFIRTQFFKTPLSVKFCTIASCF